MRLVVGVFATLLSSSTYAYAEELPSAEQPRPEVQIKVPVRVIRILPETKQVLFRDRATGGVYVLAGIGERISNYTVEAVDDREVTLSANGLQFVLATSEAIAAVQPHTPVDPYLDGLVKPSPAVMKPPPMTSPNEPIDPYGAPAPAIESIPLDDDPEIPLDPYAQPPLRTAKSPDWIEPDPLDTVEPLDSGETTLVPAVITTPASPRAPVLTRREIDVALADFASLIATFRGSFTPVGVKVEQVAAGSLFARAGVRRGDLIVSVDGKPLRSLDDAAVLYARVPSLRSMTAQVVRGGNVIALRVAIQP